MTDRTPTSIDDDPSLCAKSIQPALENIIDKGFSKDVLLFSMSTVWSSLLQERGGSGEPLRRAFEAFKYLPTPVKERVPDCQLEIRNVIEAVKREGFTLDAILWAMLGTITSLYERFGFSKDQIGEARNDMITRIHETRKSPLH